MPKDRNKAINPAAAQLKADKAKALKKGKAAVAAQRQERLAHRNPQRLQQQIDALRDSTSLRDQKTLKELEQELTRVQKAREALGTDSRDSRDRNSDARGGRREGGAAGGGGVLGKRVRGAYEGQRARTGGTGFGAHAESAESTGEETDESVRRIPMPRDTPPPAPRRERRKPQQPQRTSEQDKEQAGRQPIPSQTVYEAAPALRDLKKEAVKGLVPTAVLRKRAEASGGLQGMEPVTEHDRGGQQERETEASNSLQNATATSDEIARLEEEERRWRMEMDGLVDEGAKKAAGSHRVEMEEVEDEEA